MSIDAVLSMIYIYIWCCRSVTVTLVKRGKIRVGNKVELTNITKHEGMNLSNMDVLFIYPLYICHVLVPPLSGNIFPNSA